MGKNNNLKDFVTDIADAIREKKGITELINPQDFSSEIKSIESGIVPCEWNDVNFYDYDGTILYSYTWDEFVEKNEMPPLPTHREKEGLVCQEWNYTLEEVLEQGGRCDVGAIYDTVDGYNHIFVNILKGDITVTFYIYTSIDTVINWGDGNIENINNIERVFTTISHKYDAKGYYDIKIETSSLAFYKNIDNPSIEPHSVVELIYESKNISTEQGAFCSMKNMKAISISNKIKTFGVHMFSENTSIKHINIPKSINAIGYIQLRKSCIKTISLHNNCNLDNICLIGNNELKYFHIPNNCTFNETSIDSLLSLLKISVGVNNQSVQCIDDNLIKDNILVLGLNGNIPDYIEEIRSSAFNKCTTLMNIKLPKYLKTLNTNSFADCTNITNGVFIPNTINTIPQSCFSRCNKIPYYDFREHESIPTLASTNAFLGISTTCKIIVPDNLYDE